MIVPLAYWKTPSFGAVFFLSLLTPESDSESPVGHWHGTYERIDECWSSRGFTGTAGWGGPVGPPGATDGLQGEAIRKGGWETTWDPEGGQDPYVSLVWGWHSPEVTQILLVQGDRRDICPQVTTEPGSSASTAKTRGGSKPTITQADAWDSLTRTRGVPIAN